MVFTSNFERKTKRRTKWRTNRKTKWTINEILFTIKRHHTLPVSTVYEITSSTYTVGNSPLPWSHVGIFKCGSEVLQN